MSYQGYGNQGSNGVKWIVLFLFVIIALVIGGAAVIAGSVANPKAAAEARRVNVETDAYQAQVQQDQQLNQIDLAAHKKLQDAQFANTQAQLVAGLENQKQQYSQQLAQAQQQFDNDQRIKETVADGAVAAIVIVAAGLAILAIAWGWSKVVNASSARTAAHQSAVDAEKTDVLLRGQGQSNEVLGKIQTELAQAQKDLARLAAEAMETKVILAERDAHGNGNGSTAAEKEIPTNDKSSRLTRVK